MPKRALVLVEWLDSASGNSWQRLDEIAATGLVPMKCRSVGWVVAKDKDHIVLVAHISGDGEATRELGTGDLAIPRKCVTRILALRER